MGYDLPTTSWHLFYLCATRFAPQNEETYTILTKLTQSTLSEHDPNTNMWRISSHCAGTLWMFSFRLVNEGITGWSASIHWTTSSRTYLTNFSIVRPSATKPMVRCICCIVLSVTTIVYDNFPASSSHCCIHMVIICIFFCISSIWPSRDVPSFNQVNHCIGPKVHLIAFILSYYIFLSLLATSIFFTYGSS